MDFRLNDEQRMIQDSVRKFAREKILPNARDWDRLQAALAQQGLRFAHRNPREETGGHLKAAIVPIITAEYRAQELLKQCPAARGDRVDQTLAARATRTGLGLQIDHSLFGEAGQQVIQRRLLEIHIDRSMSHQDAVQFITVPGAGMQDAEYHQHAGCLRSRCHRQIFRRRGIHSQDGLYDGNTL